MSLAWADHGGGLGRAASSPVAEALFWAGLTLLVGVVLVAIITVLARRRTSSE